MPWSSKSIARLAAALAKAQAELKNPEKTLTATIYPERRHGEHSGVRDGDNDGGRTFNYASLASGLEIVRTTLSQHGIAVVQTTAVDDPGQLVKLTTVLAHSSGEWIASDWPVCSIKDTQTPHRMGMALTYARRYSLFALVGIAGEDDLDAPDLQSPTISAVGGPSGTGQTNGRNGNGHIDGRHDGPLQSQMRAHGAAQRVVLGPEQSAALRDRLLGELNAIASADDGALWAYCNLRAKDGLTAADAQTVEAAFQAKLSALAAPDLPAKGSTQSDASPRNAHRIRPNSGKPRRDQAAANARLGIDKSVLAFPEPRRIRDREHVRFVAKQPCLICGRVPSDPHHLRFAQSRALGRKVSDEFTVPLCRGHHREVHRCGDEASWWQAAAIDPAPNARELWLQTHPQLRHRKTPAGTNSAAPPAVTRHAVLPAERGPTERIPAARGRKPRLQNEAN
jgi:hypothetical protein